MYSLRDCKLIVSYVLACDTSIESWYVALTQRRCGLLRVANVLKLRINVKHEVKAHE